MKILAVSLVAIVMLLSGCVGYIESEAPSTPMPPAPVPETPMPEAPVPEQPVEAIDQIDQTEVVLPDEPPINRTWVSPGKVNIGNFYPGARAEYPMTIHNGNDTNASFAVVYRYPDHVATGYVKPPIEAQDWVIIADSTPILMPKETRDVLIVLAMPEDANINDKKWEFWISIMDTTQTGNVKTELCVRWLVDMR